MLRFEQFGRDYTTTPTPPLAAGLALIFSRSVPYTKSPLYPFFFCVIFCLAQFVAASARAQLPDTPGNPESRQDTLDEALATNDYNAYDQRLVDPLWQQALYLQESGSHGEAVILFKEAIHILRINQGLYNDAQLDLLDAMIESEISLQNWETVDQLYGYMEHLYRRLYDIMDPRLEVGLQKVVSWHVNALNVNIDGKRIEHLQQANKLFKLRLQIAQLTLQTGDPKLEFLNRNIEICERQLFLASDLNREMQKQKQRSRQNALLADRD